MSRHLSHAAVLVAIMAASFLAGCLGRQDLMSLEEANQVTLRYQDAGFIPPPRSIQDIREALGEIDIDDPDRTCLSDPILPVEEIARGFDDAPPWDHINCKAIKLLEWGRSDLKTGQFARAAELFRAAKQSSPDAIVFHKMMDALRAKSLAYLGNFRAARWAMVFDPHSSATVRLKRRQYWTRYYFYSAKGTYEQMRGNLAIGERYFRKAVAECEEGARYGGSFLAEAAFTRTELAENLRLQGRLLEAEALARDLLKNPTTVFSVGLRQKTHLALSRVLFEQGRYPEAEYLARAAVDAYTRTGIHCTSLYLNLALQTLARSLVVQQQWEEAVRRYESIRNNLAPLSDLFRVRFLVDASWPLALLASGRIAEAEEHLSSGLEEINDQFGIDHYRSAEIRALQAVVLAETGQTRQALERFQGSIPTLIERYHDAGDASASGASRGWRLVFILEAYIELLSKVHGSSLEQEAGIDAAAEAFRLADIARNDPVRKSVGESCARAAVDDPALEELIRREQDARKQVRVLREALINALSLDWQDRDLQAIESLREQIGDLGEARRVLAAEIEDRLPGYAALVSPRPPDLEAARKGLRQDECLVALLLGRTRSYVWAVPKSGITGFFALPVTRDDVKDRVGRIRSSLTPRGATLDGIPPFDFKAAHWVYQQFLEPVEDTWREAHTLMIIPHGALGYLPFSLLVRAPFRAIPSDRYQKAAFSGYRRAPWLLRDHSIAVSPSVATWIRLRSQASGAVGRRAFVGFGDPLFSKEQASRVPKPHESRQVRGLRGLSVVRPKTETLDSAALSILPRLPETAEEIRSIGRALRADPDKDLFTGVRANEEQVKEMDLSRYRIVAFATHGLAPGDLDGLIQPALAMSAPDVASVEGDGLLTMEEVFGLRLRADWVVLSACNTGAGREEGAEALSGLGLAFFYAGARALLVSHWPVETTSARELTTRLFKNQAADQALSRPEALRRSMLSLLDEKTHVDPSTGEEVFSYAHPIFWAPFTLVGDE